MLIAYMRLGVDPNFVLPVVAQDEAEMGVTQAGLRGQGFVNTNLNDNTPVTHQDYWNRIGYVPPSMPPAPFAEMTEVGQLGA